MATQVDHATIEHLRAVMPGQPIDWYIRIGQLIIEGLMPMPAGQLVSPQRQQKPVPVKVAVKPLNVVSEATRTQLLERCLGNMASVERRVAEERDFGISEEKAWQRALKKFDDERSKLYANIGYNS